MIRFFDILFSLLAIVFLFPFMVPIMIGLKLTGEHDVFYRQERIGRYGKPFMLWKFATMKRNSPSMSGGMFTSVNDPRILPMGGFLRKTKINELPQLINILKGDMSVIGYRPTTAYFFNKYSKEVKEKIYDLRPGLSGLASVIFSHQDEYLQKMDNRAAFYDNVISPYKGNLEIWYANHRSIGNYFKLIILTLETVINPKSKRWKYSFKELPPIPKELEPYL